MSNEYVGSIFKATTTPDISKADTAVKTNNAGVLDPSFYNFDSILYRDTLAQPTPLTPVLGQIWYNMNTGALCFWDGTIWIKFGQFVPKNPIQSQPINP